MRVQARTDSSSTRCALCHGEFSRDAVSNDAWTCSACGTQLHAECLSSVARCPTLGCSVVATPTERATPAVTARARARSRSWWKLRVALVLLLLWFIWMRGTPPRWHWLGYGGPPSDIVFVPERGWVIGRLGDVLRIWSLETNEQIERFGEEGERIALSPKHDAVASGEFVYSIPDGKKLVALPRGFEAVAFSPDGSRIAGWLRQESNLLALVSSSDGSLVAELGDVTDLDELHAAALAFSPDGTLIAAPCSGVNGMMSTSGIAVWTTKDGRFSRRITTAGRGWGAQIAFTPANAIAEVDLGEVWAEAGASARLFDASSGLRLRRVTLGEPRLSFIHAVPRVGVSSRLAAIGASNGNLRVVSLDDGSVKLDVSSMQQINIIRFSPDGRYVAVGGSEDIAVWELPL